MKISLEPIRLDHAHGGSASIDCIDFSTSLNPLGPPKEAIRAYHEAIADISRYPSPYPHSLEASIAARLDVDPETVIAGNGSTQLIYLAARTLSLKSPSVVVPTFSELANALIAAGSEPMPIFLKPEANFLFQSRALCDALEAGADGIFLGRPNSPTGTFIGMAEIAELGRECRRREAWCVVDEAFIEFADDSRSAVKLVETLPNLVILRSLTKIFAIPGLRLGYLVGPADFVRKMRETIEPWSVNTIAERVALACLDGTEHFVAATRQIIREERSLLQTKLRRLPALRVFPSTANFLMFAVGNEPETGHFGRFTLSQGIAVRDLSALPGCGSGFYRIGLRSRPDNDRFVSMAAVYPGRKENPGRT